MAVSFIDILHTFALAVIINLLQILYQILQQQIGTTYTNHAISLSNDGFDVGTEHPSKVC